jgi:hypothetical protein
VSPFGKEGGGQLLAEPVIIHHQYFALFRGFRQWAKDTSARTARAAVARLCRGRKGAGAGPVQGVYQALAEDFVEPGFAQGHGFAAAPGVVAGPEAREL